MHKKNTVMTIDPGGTTGICFVNDGFISFQEYKSSNWENHLDFIINLVRKNRPRTIVYETTNYIHKRMPSSLSLLKLIGGIVGTKHAFTFVKEVNSIAVNQVKIFKKKIFAEQEQIEDLTCEVGRGKGWKYKRTKISLHQLDALVIYHLWSKGSLESQKKIKEKIFQLRAKKRLGVRQKEQLKNLEGFVVER